MGDNSGNIIVKRDLTLQIGFYIYVCMYVFCIVSLKLFKLGDW